MGCGASAARAHAVRTCVRRCDTRVAIDLEPLVLSDPDAQRAVLDFMRADAGSTGELEAADFSRMFGLDDDLYLRRLVQLYDTTGNGTVSLSEFLVGVAHFAGSCALPRDTLICRFAFKLLDVRNTGVVDRNDMEKFVAAAYEQFKTNPSQRRDTAWGDPVGERTRAYADVRTCMARITRTCPDGRVTLRVFETLAAELPLLVAPAAFIWTTFEDLAPACKFVCAAMVAHGHKQFDASVWGSARKQQPQRGRNGSGGGAAAAQRGGSPTRSGFAGDAALRAFGGGSRAAAPARSPAPRAPPAQPRTRRVSADAFGGGFDDAHVAPEDDDPDAVWNRGRAAAPPAEPRGGSYRSGGLPSYRSGRDRDDTADSALQEIVRAGEPGAYKQQPRGGALPRGGGGGRDSARVAAEPWDSGEEECFDDFGYGRAEPRAGRRREPPPMQQQQRQQGQLMRGSGDPGGIGDYGEYAAPPWPAALERPRSAAMRPGATRPGAMQQQQQQQQPYGGGFYEFSPPPYSQDAQLPPPGAWPPEAPRTGLGRDADVAMERELLSLYETAVNSPRYPGQSRLAAAAGGSWPDPQRQSYDGLPPWQPQAAPAGAYGGRGTNARMGNDDGQRARGPRRSWTTSALARP